VRVRALALASIYVGCVAIACGGKKTPPPELTGLAAVPASAQVAIAVDVARVMDAPLVERAADKLLARDVTLASRWSKLRAACKLELGKQIKRLVIAIGPAVQRQAGAGPVLVVATGELVESELAACVRAMVGEGGGSLTATTAAGRTIYQVQDGTRVVYFAFGRADTVVLGSDSGYVADALGSGAKLSDDPDAKKYLSLVDQSAPAWAIGKVDERVRAGLLRVTGKQLSAGPAAFVVTFDPSHGAKIDLGAVMASATDAKTLESFAKGQMALLGMAAQAKGLMKIVDSVKVVAQDNVVRFRASLDVDDLNLLVSVLDGRPVPAQDSPPAPGSGADKPK
jgi:hypothetical protein